jgi:PAS domain S-box-containing protein
VDSYSELLNNAILLLALGVIYDTLGLYKIRQVLLRDSLSGLLVGLLGMAVMLTPWMLAPGIFFDTRWVLISLCGVFFGFVPTVIAVLMTVTLRLFQGGTGAFVGSLVIVVSAVIGLIWRRFEYNRDWKLSWFNLYILGFLVQVAVLCCMYFLPVEVRLKVVIALAPPLLIIFPFGSMLLGLVLRRQRDRRATELALDVHRSLLDRERGLLRGLIDSIPDIIFFKDSNGRYLGYNQAFEQMTGITEQTAIGKTDQNLFEPEIAELFHQHNQEVIETGIPFSTDQSVSFQGGKRRMLSIRIAPFYGLDGTLYGLVGIGRDTTRRWQAEQDREQLQDQLAQAQKIESVGQLAGGIAHDFNNMLAVILGQAEMASMQLDNQPRLKVAISEIQNAANRSSNLTKQLLAFARKQPTVPLVLDLNERITDMFKMLRLVIGEDIELRLHLAEDLWRVKIDPSQVDQILTNFCVNARDAIGENGRVSIKTKNLTLDQNWCNHHNDLVPDDYVVISVSDNGRGIDAETRRNIFDPFFSTKKISDGTGLGLATVYGIVKQNNGFVDVYSEPGHGATFKVYLPRTEGDTAKSENTQPNDMPMGTEIILVAEDEKPVLAVAKDMLESLGYQVLSADSPGKALEVADTHSGTIDLLLTDVIMPEMNGLKLSEQLLQHHPTLKVLFMSGYTADVISQHGVLDEGISFIEKPFSMQDMAQKVRQALN